MPSSEHRNLTFSQAIREGLDQAMEMNNRVIVVGEGVPDPKSIFNTTAGLREKYGSKRVFDMPVSENGMTGICIGAAISGLRPVMVHQRIDFAMLAMDQLVNNAAKWSYMFDGKATVPIVVRMLIGRGWGQGPQHSQSLQAIFAHVPGLKVVMPVTARDSKGMLIGAIEDENPVMFIEHRWLYHISDVVPEDYYLSNLDKARIMVEGSDVTIAAFSYMAVESLIAAKALSLIGINAEVIDMRSVKPLDIGTVQYSVKKTGRLIVADTAHQTGSVAGELVSQITECAFSDLKCRPLRIALPDHPAPTSHFIIKSFYPGPEKIIDAVIELTGTKMSSVDHDVLSASLKDNNLHDVPNHDFKGPF